MENNQQGTWLKNNRQMISVTSAEEMKNGNRLMRNGKFEEAIAAYQFALKLNPYSPWSYYYLGNAFFKLSKFEQAIETYKSALKLNPNVAWFNYDLGLAFYEKGNVKKALIFFQKAVELSPEFASGYKHLGDCFLKKGKLSEAVKSYQTAFQLKPNLLVKYYSSLAKALRRQGLIEEAIALYCKIAEQNPEEYPNIPVVLSKDIGKFLELPNNNQNEKYRVSYTQINFSNPNYFNPSLTVDKNIHQNFCIKTSHYVNNFLMLVPKGRVWSNDSWGVVVTDSEDEILTKRMFRKPDIIDLMSTKNLPPALNLDGTAVFLSSRWGYNYYHWIFDVISRLELLFKGGIDLGYVDKFIVNSYQQRFQKEILTFLGIPQEKVIESYQNHHIIADKLVVPSLPLAAPSKWNCDFIRRELMPLKNQVKSTKYQERIYISRKDSDVRRLVNEDRVIEFLSTLGFQTVVLSSTSVAEQVSLFANAKVIVAVHGAALTNIVFCQSGTKIIELFGPDALRNCYYITANHCNLEHYYMIGESSRSRQDLPKNRDLDVVINIDLLSKLLQVAKVH
ncbi:tetratricopeptide repeat protein [Okeania sp.]|uniref:tetratricopeptide repeat protein n=1 Tax=Okeania sp. TaxID=3100323 RepID=UPI002B4B9118|nr:tetratricopeptide repeat protein [Okeania sp.]MEB3343440.1 tetratricopeptide repeat protein [Okeania sp.]